LGVAAIVEVAAYYVPFVDNLLDTLTTPLSVGAGTVLSAAMLTGINDPMLQWGLGALVGGGSAGLVQAGTAVIRSKISAFTGGTGNATFATAENGLATTLSIFAIVLPVVAGLCIFALFYFIVKKLFFKKKSTKNKTTINQKQNNYPTTTE
jgi:hypothetical protein